MSNDLFFHRRRFGPPSRVYRIALFVPLTVLTLSGCDQRFGFPDPATEQGKDVLDLWLVSLYAAVALGVLVLGVLFYSMIRHRRRHDNLPKQTEGSVPWEVTYTVIPFIIVGLLFAYGLKVQNVQTALKKNPDVRIDVTAYQWNWRFEYKESTEETERDEQTPTAVTVNGDNVTLPELVLPVNERVRFNLIAADVAHAFFVPDFVTKRDVIPGIHNEIEVTPNRTGSYIGHCAEYCGLNHSAMNFRVKVVTQAEYKDWLEQQKGKA